MKRTLAFLTVLILAGCAAPLLQTPPPGVAARIDPPQMKVGDTWRYAARDGYTGIAKGTLEYRVSAISDDTATVMLQHEARTSDERYTRDGNWRERPMTNLQNFRYNPPYPALPFPLEAGKTWQAYVEATDPATGHVNRVRIDGKVLGWERIKVPAGEFDALKIRRIVYAGNHDDYFRSEEQITEFDWYAPQLGHVVKNESSSGYYEKMRGCDFNPGCTWRPNDWSVVELVSYRSADAR